VWAARGDPGDTQLRSSYSFACCDCGQRINDDKIVLEVLHERSQGEPVPQTVVMAHILLEARQVPPEVTLYDGDVSAFKVKNQKQELQYPLSHQVS
jgi:hypothetical protein